MDINGIKEILPHRYPFLFVDRVVEEKENGIIAIKSVTINEPFFVGHFPDFPLMPGVLLCEALAQTAGIFLLKDIPKEERKNRVPLFLGLDKVRFKKMVRPGDTLKIKCELIQKRENIFRFQGEIKVEEEIALTGEILLGFKEK
ncbi:MAG: 3-hydroxyacyl-ACP dehydratase FabZ [candidate division WOR-3 bacterium]